MAELEQEVMQLTSEMDELLYCPVCLQEREVGGGRGKQASELSDEWRVRAKMEWRVGLGRARARELPPSRKPSGFQI